MSIVKLTANDGGKNVDSDRGPKVFLLIANENW